MAPRPEYEKEILLGTGGMAEVWRAHAPDGPVAIKSLLPHAAHNPSLAVAFEREGKLLQRIRHPNVVGIHDILRDGQGPILVLEYVRGVDLRSMAKAHIQPPIVLRVAREILCALEAVHDLRDETGKRLGVIHRDLTPSNVLISTEGAVKLTDFGIARAEFGTHATAGMHVKGTVAYLSPEQASGAPVDQRADLFAVGAIMYELFACAPIYDDTDPRLMLERARAGDVRSLGESRSDLPPSVVELVDRALCAQSGDRFPTAVAMRQELERVAEFAGGLASQADLAMWSQSVYREPSLVPPRGRRARRLFGSLKRAPVVLVALVTILFAIRWLARRWIQPRSEPIAISLAGVLSPAGSGSSITTSSTVTVPREIIANPVTIVPAGKALPGAGSGRAPSVHAYSRQGVGGPTPNSRVTTSENNDDQKPGLLDLGSEPGFAYVSIDGSRVGATPLFGHEVAPGMHRIEVSREGLGTKSFTLEVRSGQRIRRVVKLP